MDDVDDAGTPRSRIVAALGELPPATVASLVLAVVVGVALSLYNAQLVAARHWNDPGWPRYIVASTALSFTILLLRAIGLGEARARVDGPARALVTIAIVALVAVLIAKLVDAYVVYYAPRHGEDYLSYRRWWARSQFGLHLVAGGALAAALVGRGRVGIALAAGLVATTVLAFPTNALWSWVSFGERDHVWANALLRIAIQVAFQVTAAAAVWLLVRGTAAPTRSGALSAGLARIEGALIARVLLAVAMAFFTVIAISGRSPGLMKLVIIVGPIALVLTQIALVRGLFEAASGPGATRGRLIAAAAATVLSSYAGWCQALAAYVVARARWGHGSDGYEIDDLARLAMAWPYVLPAIGLAGLLLLLAAVEHVRRTVPSPEPPDPATAGAWAIAGTVAALGIPHVLTSRDMGLGTVLVIAILVAIANIAATLAVARACGKAAAALRNVAP